VSRAALVELRQYRLHPGRRDELIALFEAELLETQEEAGMAMLGQFRDLDEPDRFTWLRGFGDMATRAEALGRFYYGPVWRAHREAANATMASSDDVLLLRPAAPAPALETAAPRPPGAAASGFVAVGIGPAATSVPRDAVRAAGGTVIAELRTEPSPNSFPQLPVREGEDVAVWLAACPDRAALEAVAGLGSEVRRLAPTERSGLQGAP
jgi:quinol monooxygenase YgiN